MNDVKLVEVKKYNYIDALRGIAVLGTLMVHCSIYEHGKNNYGDIFKRITFSGSNGVQLFFLMSAFTLFMSYYQKKGKEKNTKLNFFIRRFFRIAPLFYVAIVMYLMINGLGPRYWLGDQPSITPFNLISTITFSNFINPYWINSVVEGGWSITIEMLFYLTIPILVKLVTSQSRALWALSGSIVFSSFLYKLLYQHPQIPELEIWNTYCYFFFTSQLPVFFLGINLFFLLNENSSFKSFSFQNRNALIGLSLVLFAHILFPNIQEHILISIVFFIVAFAVSQSEPKFIVNRVTIFLGKLSYSMYLTHFAVLFFMWKMGLLDIIERQMVNFVLRYTILISLTTIFSYVTYRLIELPGINLGKKLILYFEKKTSSD